MDLYVKTVVQESARIGRYACYGVDQLGFGARGQLQTLNSPDRHELGQISVQSLTQDIDG